MTRNIVTGVIGSDVHTIGSKLLSYAIRKAGFNVTDIGVSVSQEELINAAIETNSQAILISSLYGHGELDCRGFRAKCIETGLNDIKFLDMGFDRVGYPGMTPNQVIAWLEEDLK